MNASKATFLPISTAEEISNLLPALRSTFRSQKTKSLEYRLHQLRSLYWALHDNSSRLVEACYLDSGKPGFESLLSEVDWCKNEIIFMSRNLKSFMKDEKALDQPWEYKAMSPTIRKEPLGTVLIIGPYNFPVQLAITPFIGAIAAGCTAVLKPSEMAVNTAIILTDIISKSLDPTAYAVINGGIPETTALLAQKWDKIFFTGSVGVGSIVARKAAETLTPVTLELGGKNPAIVSKNANIRLAARRLLWGKLMNAGQMCVSENYVMVEKEVCDELLEEMKSSMNQFFPAGCRSSSDYGRIIDNRQFTRIKKLLHSSEGEIIYGGDTEEETNYIGLTIVKVKTKNDSLLASETFGPPLPHQLRWGNDRRLLLPLLSSDSSFRWYRRFGYWILQRSMVI